MNTKESKELQRKDIIYRKATTINSAMELLLMKPLT